MKVLLTITSVFEGLTGLALAIIPELTISTLLGVTPTDPAMTLIARIGGIGLILLAIACWVSRTGLGAFRMVRILTGYNILATLGLIGIAMSNIVNSPGLWMAVFIHLVLLGWSIANLRKVKPRRT